MRRNPVLAWFVLSVITVLVLAGHGATSQTRASAALVAVTTQHNDNLRSGVNSNETMLTISNVNVNQFGKLFTRTVDGRIYAQPLVVPNLSIPGQGTHNVVFVATMHNSVYAFDADSPTASTPLWHVTLDAATSTSVPNDGCYGGINPPGEIGIISTPVIDLASNTMYVVDGTKSTSIASTPPSCNPAAYQHYLHALDLTTSGHPGVGAGHRTQRRKWATGVQRHAAAAAAIAVAHTWGGLYRFRLVQRSGSL